MADTYTISLRFTQPQVGADNGTWGGLLNTDWTLTEQAITGDPGIAIGGLTNYSLTANNGAPDDARSETYTFTGALTANCTVTMPNVVKTGWASNQTTGSKDVTMTTGGGRTAKLPHNAVPVGVFSRYQCDSTNVDLPTIYQPNMLIAAQGYYQILDQNGNISNVLGSDASSNVILRQVTASTSLLLQTASGTSSYQLNNANGDSYIRTGTANGFVYQNNAGVTNLGQMTNTGNWSIGGLYLASAQITTSIPGVSYTAVDGTWWFGKSTNASFGTLNVGIAASNISVATWVPSFSTGAPAGSINWNGSSVVYGSASDYRLKTVFGEYDAGTLFDNVKVYDAEFTAVPGTSRQPMILAHEIAELAPQSVTGVKDAVTEEGHVLPQQFDGAKLVPAILAELKALRRRVKELEERT